MSIPTIPLDELFILINAAKKLDTAIVPTNAGLLFFHPRPQQCLPQAVIRVVVFHDNSMDATEDSRVFEGPLITLIEEVWAFMNRYLPLQSDRSNGLTRETRIPYAVWALREALVNAIAHRNYVDFGDIRVQFFPDRVEIISPGGFPPGVDITAPIHKPRNPIITQYLYDLVYIEKYGSGIRRMRQVCSERNLPEPEFRLKEYETAVVFHQGRLEAADRIQGLVRSQGSVTSKMVMRELTVSKDTANRYLREMIEKGLIRRDGQGKATRYIE